MRVPVRPGSPRSIDPASFTGSVRLTIVIDPSILRTDPDSLRESQRRRGEDVTLIDRLVEADVAKRAAGLRFDELRSAQKEIGKQIGPLQGSLKKTPDAAKQAELWGKLFGDYQLLQPFPQLGRKAYAPTAAERKATSVVPGRIPGVVSNRPASV